MVQEDRQLTELVRCNNEKKKKTTTEQQLKGQQDYCLLTFKEMQNKYMIANEKHSLHIYASLTTEISKTAKLYKRVLNLWKY